MTDFDARPGYLKNKIILLTGAAKGIGRAVAIAYASYGAQLVLLDRDHKALDQVHDEIVNLGKEAPVLVNQDLAAMDKPVCLQLKSELQQEFTQLHGLVFCAAELGNLTPLHLYNDDLYHRVMTVNLQSTLILTQVFYPLLQQTESASVIFSSSDIARHSRAYWGAYAIAGFAVEGMMQTWAREQGEGSEIRFNCINPGKVATRMRSRAYPGDNTKELKQPREVVSPYLYLMSEQSAHINGETLQA